MSVEFSLPLRVYIEDTDAGGIVYYVNYLKYFERARTELMRSRGFARAALPADGLQFVVSALRVDYRAPARLDDMLEVAATVTAVGAATVTFEQQAKRGDTVLVTANVLIALVDALTGRPRRLPTELRASLVGAV